MDQRAALPWYHDHVMGITKLDVYAGLAGLWIVRDDRERELGLPEGPPFEVPLLIQARNFDLDEQGRLVERLRTILVAWVMLITVLVCLYVWLVG